MMAAYIGSDIEKQDAYSIIEGGHEACYKPKPN